MGVLKKRLSGWKLWFLSRSLPVKTLIVLGALLTLALLGVLAAKVSGWCLLALPALSLSSLKAGPPVVHSHIEAAVTKNLDTLKTRGIERREELAIRSEVDAAIERAGALASEADTVNWDDPHKTTAPRPRRLP